MTTPEDIRRLYREEEPATDEEAAQTQHDVRTDPDEARRMIKAVFALSAEDQHFTHLASAFISSVLMRDIQERAAADDAEALRFGVLITELMRVMPKPPEPTPRGKPKGGKTTRSA